MQRAIVYDTNGPLEQRTDAFDNWHVDYDPSNHSDYVCRTRWQEIELIKAAGLTLFFTVNDTNKVYTKDWMPVEDLADWKLLPRTSSGKDKDVLGKIVKAQGKPYITAAELQAVEQWIDVVRPEFVKRRIMRVSWDDVFREDGQDRVFKLGNPAFVKSERKASSRVVRDKQDITELLAGVRHRGCLHEPMLISEYLNFVQVDGRNEEYRCVVVDGQITSVAPYYGGNTPDDIRLYTQEFVRAHQDILPKTYVVDVGRTKSKEIVVVECGNITSIGLPVETYSEVIGFIGGYYRVGSERVEQGTESMYKEEQKRLATVRAAEKIKADRMRRIDALLDKIAPKES
jgi:hypothetical protein